LRVDVDEAVPLPRPGLIPWRVSVDDDPLTSLRPAWVVAMIWEKRSAVCLWFHVIGPQVKFYESNAVYLLSTVCWVLAQG
jgi:hypothetical protein